MLLRLIFFLTAFSTSLPQVAFSSQISRVEIVPTGSRVLFCDDELSSVDEIISQSLTRRDDLTSSNAPDQKIEFDLVIISHRAAISKFGCGALSAREVEFVHSKYEVVSIYRAAAARQIPELAAALREASCQPLYGIRLSEKKAVSIVLYQGNSRPAEDAARCAEKIMDHIKTTDEGT